MSRDDRRERLVAFLQTIQKPDQPFATLADDDLLVTFVDSLSVLAIVTYLEEAYGVDFGVRGIDPDELCSIGSILDLIEREAS